MKNGNVLIIEDDPKNMKLLKLLLQINGNYTILEAENAEDGIEITRKYHPDIILMDIQLPGMNGVEATRLIKSDPELMDIPVIAVTASAMQVHIDMALEVGCAGHISKPIDIHSFVDAMEQLVAEPQTI